MKSEIDTILEALGTDDATAAVIREAFRKAAECERLREALRERCDAAERKRCTECNGGRNYEVDRKNGIPQHQDWCWVPGGRALLSKPA